MVKCSVSDIPGRCSYSDKPVQGALFVEQEPKGVGQGVVFVFERKGDTRIRAARLHVCHAGSSGQLSAGFQRAYDATNRSSHTNSLSADNLTASVQGNMKAAFVLCLLALVSSSRAQVINTTAIEAVLNGADWSFPFPCSQVLLLFAEARSSNSAWPAS